MKTTLNLTSWWNQFPQKLRLLTRGRFFASVGAGGVLYLTPLVFNNLAFSATQIGSGLTAAAFAGTITRLTTGLFLDKGGKYATPLKTAAITAIIADLLLLTAGTYRQYLIGEIFLGAAAGIYWPSIELAVPITCGDFQSSKGFALVRSADAFGISAGALIGSLAASADFIRFIYCVEIACMFSFIYLLMDNRLQDSSAVSEGLKDSNRGFVLYFTNKLQEYRYFVPKLFPILTLSLLSTGILSLLQSALPIDLVLGGIKRAAINESFIGGIIAIQLTLLLLIQWPIGNWLTKRNIRFGLYISLLNFSIGCLLLGLSNIFKGGLIIAAIGLVPISIGLASFLPTATEVIVQISPINYRGLSMAIYSQCFGLSAIFAPWLAGLLIDTNGNALLLWLITSILCIFALPLISKIRVIRA
ncbi:putative multidrug efflux transporter [Prochlorococcus sp. MIT 0601]|nr:putative multidrug efflux transporter [Prochlorococcus sp. MIT 0601]